MKAGWFGGRLVVLGAALALGAPAAFHAAQAAQVGSSRHSSRAAVHAIKTGPHYASSRRWVSRSSWSGVLQCVPFARENTGIELTGNANTWWSNAVGVYERGSKPEVGSILNFRATRRMRMGHVAVVTNVLDSRRIEIDHANWAGPGEVNRDIEVVDVSPDNDWTAVRVALGHSEEYGSVYPTFGFIYDRPDRGTMVANSGVMPIPALDTASAGGPIDTAGAAAGPEEVAEAVDDAAPRARRYRRGQAMRAHAAPRATYRLSSRAGGLAKPHMHRRPF